MYKQQQQKRQNRKPRRRGARSRPGGGTLAIRPVFPATRMVTLVYTDRKLFSESGAAAGAGYTYSLINLYDPDKTGTGSQPINFDQVCTLYSFFRVMKVSYTIEMQNATAYTPGSVVSSATVGVVPTWNDALPTTVFSWLGLAGSRVKLLTPLGGSNIAKFQGTVLPYKLLGIPKRQYLDDTDYLCSSTGGPSRNVYLNLFTVGNSVGSAILSSVQLVYEVQCSIPVLNSLS